MSLHRIFKPLWKDGYDTAILTGGRASGKSHAVSQFLENLTFEPDHVILYSRYTLIAAGQSVIPEFTDKIERLNHEEAFNVTKTEIENTMSGSRIIFRGMHTSSGNQTAKLKSIQGLSTFVLDEAEEVTTPDDFDVIDYSIRSKKVKNRVILILNPTTKESWIYKRWFEEAGVQEGFCGIKNRVLYIHTTYKHNIDNLSPKFLTQVEQLRKTNPVKYNHIIEGGWLHKVEGAIYTNWRIDEYDDTIPYGFGLDFGFAYDPDALCQVAIDEKRKKVYLKQLIYENGLTTPVLIRKLRQHCNMKAKIVADSAESRLIQEIRNEGFNIHKTVKKAGSIIEGIRLLQGYEMIVDPGSIGLIKELNNYCWSDKKSETAIDDYNHLLDGIRYYVMSSYRKEFTLI